MLTYSKIGYFGRLGNQLFQFASTYGIAKKLGYEVAFPIENSSQPVKEDFKDGLTREITFDVPKYFKIPEYLLIPRNDILFDKTYSEPHFHCVESIESIPDNCDISGYYQSEKYFKHCEKELRSILKFKDDIVESVNYKFKDVLSIDKLTSVHIRVGDYVGLQQFHPIMDPDYYQRALSLLIEDTDLFLIFSDNIGYSKQIFPEDSRIVYIEIGSDIEQLCLMSLCKNNIIANSSYSWWSAWLNPKEDKKVVAPKKWFGSAYQYTHNTKDLYCENWIIT